MSDNFGFGDYEAECRDEAMTQPSQAGREPRSSVVLAERACKTEQGKLALYHIAGKLDSLPSYGLLPGKDHMVSWKQVHELLRKAQEGR